MTQKTIRRRPNKDWDKGNLRLNPSLIRYPYKIHMADLNYKHEFEYAICRKDAMRISRKLEDVTCSVCLKRLKPG